MRTTLYLVRHGTTDWNDQHRLQGTSDIPLNAMGLTQGALLTGYFADIPIDLGVTSPLLRARQTLDFVLGARKDTVPILVEPGIQEIYMGILEGRPVPEVNLLFPDFAQGLMHEPGTASAPEGETAGQVYDRMRDTILRIVAEHPGKTIAMASHGFAIQTWLNYASGIPASEMREWVLDNVAVSKFTFDEDGRITIDYIGDHHHLPEECRRNYDWSKLSRPMPLLLYLPMCPLCRRAAQFLTELNIPYLERDMKDAPLRAAELAVLLERHSGPVQELFNVRSPAWREDRLREALPHMGPNQVADTLAGCPGLVRHPLLLTSSQLLPGFQEAAWRGAFSLT